MGQGGSEWVSDGEWEREREGNKERPGRTVRQRIKWLSEEEQFTPENARLWTKAPLCFMRWARGSRSAFKLLRIGSWRAQSDFVFFTAVSIFPLPILSQYFAKVCIFPWNLKKRVLQEIEPSASFLQRNRPRVVRSAAPRALCSVYFTVETLPSGSIVLVKSYLPQTDRQADRQRSKSVCSS